MKVLFSPFLILENLRGSASVREICAMVECRELLQFLLLKPRLLFFAFASTWAGFSVQEPARAM